MSILSDRHQRRTVIEYLTTDKGGNETERNTEIYVYLFLFDSVTVNNFIHILKLICPTTKIPYDKTMINLSRLHFR